MISHPRFALLAAAATLVAAAPPPAGPATPAAPAAVQKDVPAAASCAALSAGPLKVASDPEEGGQIAARKTTTAKPKIGDMTVTHKADTASTKMMSSTAPSSDSCAASPH